MNCTFFWSKVSSCSSFIPPTRTGLRAISESGMIFIFCFDLDDLIDCLERDFFNLVDDLAATLEESFAPIADSADLILLLLFFEVILDEDRIAEAFMSADLGLLLVGGSTVLGCSRIFLFESSGSLAPEASPPPSLVFNLCSFMYLIILRVA